MNIFSRSMRSSFLKRPILLLATFPLRSFAQDFGYMDTQQELFQQNRHLAESLENLPQGIVNAGWDEGKEREIEAGDLPVVDRILEPQTIPHFLEFSMIGKLPGGSKTSLPLISEEYIPLLMTPYADWAPSPYNKLPNSAMTQIMIRIGSNEDDARLVVVEKKIQAMKSRLWEGIIPLSRNRWRKKRLDQPENFGMALQYLSGVVDAFNYLLQPPVSTNLRETFNLIHKELGDFEKAVNALKKGQGIKVTGLWEEYIGASYKVMTTRAHSWIIEHIKELRVPIIEAIKAHEPEDFETYSPEQWTLTNKLHDLTELGARADFTILMSMDGYMGFSPLPNATEGQSPDLEKRKKYYGDRLKLLSRKKSFNSITLKNLAQEPSAEPRRESRGLGDPLDIIETYGEQTEAQDELREEIREPFTLELGEKSPEQWIVDLRDQVLEREEDPVKEWGFVIYRLTYSQTDDEWNAFKHKFEADAADWGDGVDGADLIRDMAKLKWVDGQEHGIADGDVAAATKHFLDTQEQAEEESGGKVSGVKSDIFLFADSASVASYTSQPLPDDRAPAGDFGGFVTAVEAGFDPNDPGDHADESPGFTGQLRVLGGLVWSDLYALAQAQVAYPEDLWPLAMYHPSKVFVGPTVSAQRQAWKR